MKVRISLIIAAVALVFFIIGRGTATQSVTLKQQTMENLSTAMHGEAFAYAKYLLYAQHARQAGHDKLADLFEETAKVERFQHLAEEAQLAGLVGNDVDNLNDAITGESYEVDKMYLEFAQQAAAAGDQAAADRFEEIRQDEMGHRDAFKAALQDLAEKNAHNR